MWCGFVVPYRGPLRNRLQVGQALRTLLRVCFTVLQTEQCFTGFYTGFLYRYGIQSILLGVLTIALSVASTPTVDYFLASSLYVDLSIVLTIVHFNSTSILSLHNRHPLYVAKHQGNYHQIHLTKPELRNTQIGQLCVELTNRKKLTNGEPATQGIGQYFKLVNGLQQIR